MENPYLRTGNDISAIAQSLLQSNDGGLGLGEAASLSATTSIIATLPTLGQPGRLCAPADIFDNATRNTVEACGVAPPSNALSPSHGNRKTAGIAATTRQGENEVRRGRNSKKRLMCRTGN